MKLLNMSNMRQWLHNTSTLLINKLFLKLFLEFCTVSKIILNINAHMILYLCKISGKGDASQMLRNLFNETFCEHDLE